MHLTVEAQRVMDSATELAADRVHNYLGADHVAIALLSSRDTEAARALRRLRVRVPQLRRALLDALPPSQSNATARRIASPRLKQVLQLASRLAAARDRGPVGTEDLLVALLRTEGPTRDQIVSAVISAAGDSAYSFCVVADVLRASGDIFRDRETYPGAPKA